MTSCAATARIATTTVDRFFSRERSTRSDPGLLSGRGRHLGEHDDVPRRVAHDHLRRAVERRAPALDDVRIDRNRPDNVIAVDHNEHTRRADCALSV